MAVKEALLPEFDHEMATTRRVLERVPEEQPTWQPHPKSTSLGELAMHLAQLPRLAVSIVGTESLDIAPPGGPPRVPPALGTRDQMLHLFDDNVAQARTAIAGLGDAEFLVPWTLRRAGTEIVTMPRAAALRALLLNHMIHHRGQLTVYLRLRDVPLPSVYGPTADEGRM